MVRRFDPESPVAPDLVRDLVGLATRAPSAGFSQGWDYLALLGREQISTFWSAATEQDDEPDAWLRGIMGAPALVLCLSNPTAYLDRYAEPDKGWTDRSLHDWPIPYWDTDVAMGAMLLLLGAVEAGLGGLFFGVPAEGHDAVKEALGIPGDRRIVGVVALGRELPHPKSPSLRRGRRPVEDVLHFGRFGASGEAASGASAKMMD